MLKIISLNIEGRKHLSRVMPFFEREKPDVICLQEIYESDFEKIEKETGMKGIFEPTVLKLFSYDKDNSLVGIAFLVGFL